MTKNDSTSRIILAGGPLPKTLRDFTGVNSRLNLPFGALSGVELVLGEVAHILPARTSIVVDNNTEEVPSWIASKYPGIRILNFPGVSPGVAASVNFALRFVPDQDSVEVLYADSLTGRQVLEHPAENKIAVAQPAHRAGWDWLARTPCGALTISPDFIPEYPQMRALSGYFRFSQAGLLRELLSQVEGSTLDFLELLSRYETRLGEEFEVIFDSDWADFGHLEDYISLRKRRLSGRQFNDLTVEDKWVLKSSSDVEKMISEREWFSQLPRTLRNFAPETREAREGYAVEYVEALSLGERLAFGALSLMEWDWASENLDNWMKSSQSGIQVRDYRYRELLAFLRDKQTQRTAHLLSRLDGSADYVATAGRTFRIADILELGLPSEGAIKKFPLAMIHGDLYFGNVLSSAEENLFRLIDPRGALAGSTVGPQIYEWAKLAQSLFFDFDSLERNHFSTHMQGRAVFVEFDNSQSLSEGLTMAREWFESRCPDPDAAIKLAQNLLIGSAALHYGEGESSFALIAKALAHGV